MKKKITGPNVSQPNEFKSKLQQLMHNIYDLFGLTKEYEYPPTSENILIHCKYVASQYERSSEFLQVLVDIMRVIYFPIMPGTFFLNSNPSFLYGGIPSTPFRLGYVSLVSKCDEDFSSFYSNTVEPYIEACGYDITQVSTTYAVVSSAISRNIMKFVDEVSITLGSGFSVNEALSLIVSSIDADVNKPQKQCYSGFCYEPALENRIRLSMWLFIPDQSNEVKSQTVY